MLINIVNDAYFYRFYKVLNMFCSVLDWPLYHFCSIPFGGNSTLHAFFRCFFLQERKLVLISIGMCTDLVNRHTSLICFFQRSWRSISERSEPSWAINDDVGIHNFTTKIRLQKSTDTIQWVSSHNSFVKCANVSGPISSLCE